MLLKGPILYMTHHQANGCRLVLILKKYSEFYFYFLQLLCPWWCFIFSARRVISWHSNKKKVSTLALTNLLNRHSKLLEHLALWSKVQCVYMPCVAHLHSSEDESTETLDSHAEDYPPCLLLLIDLILWASGGCTSDLVTKECKLHLAQADDALDELRCQLQMLSTLWD